MSDTLLMVIGGVIGALIAAISQFIIARYSKPKRERDAALAETYLKLADMSADQLEEKINLIGRLAKRTGEQDIEIASLKEKQTERDKQMVTLESTIAALQEQANKDARERSDLRAKLSEFDVKNRVLWQYCISLLEQMKHHNINPVDPPEELKTDPEIMRILKEIRYEKTDS